MAKEEKLYAVTLLFQYSVEELPSVMRICEKRIVHLKAKSDRQALRKGEALGSKEQLRYKNDQGNTVCFDFVAVTGLIDLFDHEPGDPEVWYDILTLKHPIELREELTVTIDEKGFSRRPKRRI